MKFFRIMVLSFIAVSSFFQYAHAMGIKEWMKSNHPSAYSYGVFSRLVGDGGEFGNALKRSPELHEEFNSNYRNTWAAVAVFRDLGCAPDLGQKYPKDV